MTEIKYSDEIPGTTGNYGWPVRFDVHDGFIGISQTQDQHSERIRLSPTQFKSLVKFAGK